MHQVAVGDGVHGHGFYSQLLAGAQNAQRDFATVGDNDFFKHVLSSVQ